MSKRNLGATGAQTGSNEPDPNQDKSGGGASDATLPPPDPPVEDAKTKRVRVIVEKGTLGPLLLVNGDITADPDYVALLGVKGQKKVEAVK